jgi:hypothetical protein
MVVVADTRVDGGKGGVGKFLQYLIVGIASNSQESPESSSSESCILVLGELVVRTVGIGSRNGNSLCNGVRCDTSMF